MGLNFPRTIWKFSKTSMDVVLMETDSFISRTCWATKSWMRIKGRKKYGHPRGNVVVRGSLWKPRDGEMGKLQTLYWKNQILRQWWREPGPHEDRWQWQNEIAVSVYLKRLCEVKNKLKQDAKENCHCFILRGQVEWGCKCCCDWPPLQLWSINRRIWILS